MTKKQLEKYRKEFDEFVANVEKMGGRFLTEDELRYKINGGAEETQAGNENEDSLGEPEEVAEEDDDKSFWDSVCDAVGGLVDTVTDAVSDAAHAVGEFIEDVIDFFTGGSKEDDKTVEETGSEPANVTNPTVGGSENSKSPDATQDKSTSENGKTNTNEGVTVDSKNHTYDSAAGTFSSKPSLSDVNFSSARPDSNLVAAMEDANGKSKETVNQDEIGIEPFQQSKTSGFIQAYNDCEIARAYVFPDSNSTIGFGVGGWGGCSSPDNPKSMLDNAGAHLMDIPNPSNSTTYHLDTVYFGVKVDF